MTILGNLQSMFFFGFYRSSRFEIVILLSNFNTLHTCMSCTSFICEKIEDLVESISHPSGRFSLPSLSKVNLSCFDTTSYYSERHASLSLLYIHILKLHNKSGIRALQMFKRSIITQTSFFSS